MVLTPRINYVVGNRFEVGYQVTPQINKWPKHFSVWVTIDGGTVFSFTSQRTEIAKYACESKLPGLPAEDALAKQYLEQESFGDLITADHKVLSEGL